MSKILDRLKEAEAQRKRVLAEREQVARPETGASGELGRIEAAQVRLERAAAQLRAERAEFEQKRQRASQPAGALRPRWPFAAAGMAAAAAAFAAGYLLQGEGRRAAEPVLGTAAEALQLKLDRDAEAFSARLERGGKR